MSKTSSTMGFLLLATAVAAHTSHLGLDGTPLPRSQNVSETLPSVEALQLMSLGYPSLVADYYWLRAINHFGDDSMHTALYPNLEPLVQRVVALDPYFSAAYFFAGTALTLDGMDMTNAIDMLKQGMRMRPDSWRIAFVLGFNAYYFRSDYATAAEALAHAARLPGVPSYVGPLATRVAAEAGQPEIGLQLIDTLLREVRDPKVVALYRERRSALTLEMHLKWLNRAAERFSGGHGRPPESLQELVEAQLLRSVPPEPLGGQYYLDSEGVVQTTSDDKRLRLDPLVKGTQR